MLVPPVLSPAARSPPLSTAGGYSRDAFVHRERETEAQQLDGPERGDWLQPMSSPSPQPDLARVRGIYKADKGTERIFRTPKLRNLPSPSTDVVCNYRLGGEMLSMAGLVAGAAASVTSQGFTLFFLSAAGPQGQAPACATTVAPWDPIPEGPWWGHDQSPCPVRGSPGFWLGSGWLIAPRVLTPLQPIRARAGYQSR